MLILLSDKKTHILKTIKYVFKQKILFFKKNSICPASLNKINMKWQTFIGNFQLKDAFYGIIWFTELKLDVIRN